MEMHLNNMENSEGKHNRLHDASHSTGIARDEENQIVDYQSTSIGDHGRAGLSTVEAERLYEEVGFNELNYIEISALQLFLLQFTGMMPFILEIACVLALAIQSFIDFAIIFIILLTNSCLGFHEEIKAKESLAELTNKMEQKVTVVRDGRAETVVSRLLVPGDVILLSGGTLVPADVDWLEGDALPIDTSTITGEAIARKYPSQEYGCRILAGTTVQSGEAYCIVRKTGSHTEIGSSQEDIMHDKAAIRKSEFEKRVYHIVKTVICIAVIIVLTILLVQGLARGGFKTSTGTRGLISSVLSILVASVPVALPLVLQVTMALGAGTMARDYNAVVTSLSALQDISSMTVLCSDKTGTLTTARISIHEQSIWCPEHSTFKPKDVTMFARLASNPDKEDDPVDHCCLDNFRRHSTDQMLLEAKRYKLVRSVGFNPVYKRVVFVYSHPDYGVVTVAKGLPNKVVDTSDGGKDDADDQWKVVGSDFLLTEVNHTTEALSSRGYKTLGVSVRMGMQPWRFVGILPMLDPPRHDSAQTVRKLQEAGIFVKMITGDHQNIARETARMLGMKTNILKGEDLRAAEPPEGQEPHPLDNTKQKDIEEMIWEADGFAQVLPKDKRFIVEVLRKHFKAVVGMTGDGVNDAPALSAAQCGIAVDNATDAAKNAAAIILTTPGLSAIYSAVVESRRIFRKLRAYVVYRIASTVQIVLSLTLLIFVSNCEISSIFVILLALFNDLTLLPIAYDRQQASATPDALNIHNILSLSLALGLTQTIFTMIWAYVSYRTVGLFRSDLNIVTCSLSAQNAIWVQLAVSTELLIFSTRTTSFFWLSFAPSPWLVSSVFLGSFIISVFAAAIPAFGTLYVTDILLIWVYTLITLLIVDCIKCVILWIQGEQFAELQLEEPLEETTIEEKAEKKGDEELKETEEKEPVKVKKEEEQHFPTEVEMQRKPGERKAVSPKLRQTMRPSPRLPREGGPSQAISLSSASWASDALHGLRTFSDEALAFDIELGRQVSDRELLPHTTRWAIKAESTASEERFQDLEQRRREEESQMRRVESWIKTQGGNKPVPAGGMHLYRGLSHVPVQYQTDVSESLKGTAPRSLSGGDLVAATRRTDPAVISGMAPTQKAPGDSAAAAGAGGATHGLIDIARMHSAPASLRTRYAPPTREERQEFVPIGVIREGRITLPRNYAHYGSWMNLHRPLMIASSLRPHTPATRAITMTDRARQSLQARLKSRSGPIHK